jgi:regulator of sigma E protease
MVYVLIAILLFGVLIFVHELGHFLTARMFGVTVHEFAIGMGPKIISKVSKKSGTRYSLRLLPIGGFCSMEGEDKESEDEGSFSKKPVWQRIIITAAGSISNILIGIIVMTIVTAGTMRISTTIGSFDEGAVSNSVLEVGDEIVKVGGLNTHTGNDVAYAISKYGSEPVNVTVLRNGEKKTFEIAFKTSSSNGYAFGEYDFSLYSSKAIGKDGFFTVLGHSLAQSRLMIVMVTDSLHDLIVGKYGIKDMSGVVGVTQVISEAARERNGTVWLYFVLIAMNLGVVNLLPIPALDGGRIVFMLIELITRKKVPQKVESTIHTVGMVLLLIFMAVITVKDIIYLFK